MKKTISIFLAALMLLLLCSCGDNPYTGKDSETDTNGEPSVGIDTLKLPYSRADSLNPYLAESSINIQLMSLLYDGLYTLNKTYNPTPCIAESCIAGKSALNITLSPKAVFSDGTVITAQDVVYSFKLAKTSPAYSSRLSNISGISASSSNMLVVTLSSPDPYATACLDFPIIKNLDEGDFPLGSGRYTVKETQDAVYLVVNVKKADFNPKIKTVKLVSVKDSASLATSLEIGNTTIYYNDLSGGEYSRINANTVDMGINNLIFLTFNSKSELMANALLRQAINLSIDRAAIADIAFQGHARVAYTPFNPDWEPLLARDLIIAQNTKRAKQLIDESGYDISSAALSLLVNSDNPFKVESAKLIAQSLNSLGFVVNINSVDFESYEDAVKDKSYDMYIGEIRLNKNMDLSSLLLGGSVSSGISSESLSTARYSQMLEGGCELMDFINTFNEDLPFLPLCYRNAAVSYTNSLMGDFACCDSDIYYDIESWYFKSGE